MSEQKQTAQGSQGGKGDAPRNIFSEEYRRRYAEINWKPKKTKNKEEQK